MRTTRSRKPRALETALLCGCTQLAPMMAYTAEKIDPAGSNPVSVEEMLTRQSGGLTQ